MSDLTLDWETGAVARHDALGIRLEKLFAARDLVRSAVGPAWLDEQERRHDRLGMTDEHPLYRQLTSPTDLALVEVAELAHYLGAFTGDPAMAGVVRDLRTAKFWPVFYELAMAYRWQDAGAVVELAPPTAKGIADFKAAVVDLTFIVEVSKFEDDVVGSPTFTIPAGLIDGVLKWVGDAPLFVCKIFVHTELKASNENDVRSAAKRACRVFRQALREGGVSASAATPAATVELEVLTESSETNPFMIDEFGQMVSVREHPWHSYISDGGSRFFFQFQPEERSFRDEIVAKVKKEMQQLARTDASTVVMIDVSAFGDFSTLPFPSLQDELTDLLRQHPRVASLWFFSRQWTTAFRFKYRWTNLENPFTNALVPDEFHNRLIDREWHWDFLGERDYEISTPEADARSYAARMAFKPR